MSKQHLSAALFALLSAGSALAAEAATADVTVKGLFPGQGTVYAQLCTEAEFATFSCAVRAMTPASAETVTVSLGPVAPGRYAVSVWYDQDDSKKMETGPYGNPLEPTGASNDAKGQMGPPQFKDAAVELAPGANALSLTVALP